MTEFTIQYSVPYEGIEEIQCSSLEEVKEWLKNNQSTYEWSLDNVDVFIKQYTDVYELMRESDG